MVFFIMNAIIHPRYKARTKLQLIPYLKLLLKNLLKKPNKCKSYKSCKKSNASRAVLLHMFELFFV
jgi:hypothetical protein